MPENATPWMKLCMICFYPFTITGAEKPVSFFPARTLYQKAKAHSPMNQKIHRTAFVVCLVLLAAAVFSALAANLFLVFISLFGVALTFTYMRNLIRHKHPKYTNRIPQGMGYTFLYKSGERVMASDRNNASESTNNFFNLN